MNIIKAKVATNSEDDKFGRVKVTSPGIWADESELISSLNSFPLEKGDIVFVMFESLANPIILGKYLSSEQEYPVEGKVLFSAKKEDKWIITTLESEQLKIQSSEGFVLEGMFEGFKVTTKDGTTLSIKDNFFEVKTKDGAEVSSSDGKLISIKNKTKDLHKILKDLATALTATPTTQGSPTAQVFNTSITTYLTSTFPNDLKGLLK